MLFNTTLFACFFTGFFTAHQLLARGSAARAWLIIAGSLLFYAAWDVRYVPLLVGTALIDFAVARALSGAASPRRRRALLAGSLTLNLGVLALFKYARFFADAAHGLLAWLGLSTPEPAFALALPIGISFYTFQSMSYVIDVYRGELRARTSPRDFLAAVLFFPHLVAGPILRASTLLPQLEESQALRWEAVRRGFALIAAGLVNKAIADLLAPAADALFTAPGKATFLEAWTGALAFAGQIYGDFAGYTDIALGAALLLGVTLPANFRLPYLAASPIDFWRRWHISLSSWLRDYLYIPLGGNRRRRTLNLLLTMTLGGLWHGPNWTFVAWGAFHGALLVGSHALAARLPALTTAARPAAGVRALKWALTFYAVLLGWVLFRAQTFADAFAVLRALHSAPANASLSGLGWVCVGLAMTHLVSWTAWRPAVPLAHPARRALLWPAVALGLSFAMLLGASGRAFIYFQF